MSQASRPTGDNTIATEAFGASAEAVLQAYSQNYASRIRKSRQGPFGADLQNALVGLFYLRRALAQTSTAARAADVDAIDAVTRRILERGSSHSAPMDIAGYTWAAAWGTLPIAEPPLPHLELVLASGSGGRAVAGVLGSAWRSLFLATAWHLFGAESRRRATVELDRRVGYLRERVPALVDASDLQPRANQVAQVAVPVAELAERLGDADLARAASRLAAFLADEQLPDGSVPAEAETSDGTPTAHVAQFAVGAHALGLTEVRDNALAFLLRHRVARGRNLLQRTGHDDGSYEVSAWVPLALLSASPVAPHRFGPAKPARMGGERGE